MYQLEVEVFHYFYYRVDKGWTNSIVRSLLNFDQSRLYSSNHKNLAV